MYNQKIKRHFFLVMVLLLGSAIPAFSQVNNTTMIAFTGSGARIDGAGEYRIFNLVILPIIVPALAAQAIFTFVGSWNNFITPFVLISSEELFTLPMIVQTLRFDIYRTDFGGIYLGIAVSLLPIIIFYIFMSRFIISGLTLGGIKE